MLLLELQKTLAQLIMPSGLLWLLLLALTLLLARRRQWLPAALALAGWGLFGIAGNHYVGAALLAGLERTVPAVDLAKVEPFDAVFVLGGGTEIDPAGRPILGTSGDRVFTAARLWHQGKAGCLVASGVAWDAPGGLRDGGQETRALWLALGIPDRAMLVVKEPCRITREEIAAYRKLQDSHHWQRIALVSSAWHLPRALRLAAKAGLAVTPVGSDWRGRPQAFQLQRLVPTGEGLENTRYACWERLGAWVGR